LFAQFWGHCQGNCWNNSIPESFFHTLKVELIHQNNYTTGDIARKSIFDYIERYYNLNRMHSSLDHKIPIEVESVAWL
jgi:putative transposase